MTSFVGALESNVIFLHGIRRKIDLAQISGQPAGIWCAIGRALHQSKPVAACPYVAFGPCRALRPENQVTCVRARVELQNGAPGGATVEE